MAFNTGFSTAVFRFGWKATPAIFSAVILFSGQGCNTGTEIQDPYDLAGRVEQESGKPAAGATVVAVAISSDPKESGLAKKAGVSQAAGTQGFDTAVANEDGKYYFKSLPAGDYSLSYTYSTSGDTAPRLAQMPHVRVIKGMTLPIVKLGAPAQLLGLVTLAEDGSTVTGAYCEVENTPFSDTTRMGIFQTYLAEGTYRITCQAAHYPPSSVWTEVNSGKTKEIQISLGEFPDVVPIPPPDSVMAVYDAATGVVTLNWSKVASSQLLMYGITRRDSMDSGPLETDLSLKSPWYDVVYKGQTDTAARKVFYYSVFSLKKDHFFLSGSAPIKVVATRPTSHGADLEWRALPADGLCKVGDTARFIGADTNVFREDRLLQWVLKDSTASLREDTLTGRAHTSSLDFPCVQAGKVEIGLQVTDASGTVTRLFTPLEIQP